jgi:hypothetical protein
MQIRASPIHYSAILDMADAVLLEGSIRVKEKPREGPGFYSALSIRS